MCFMRLRRYTVLSYIDRLASFGQWPLGDILNPRDLAGAGFYHRGSDIVFCPECGIMLTDWKKDDKPFEEHAKYSKDCLFVKLYEKAEIVISDEEVVKHWMSTGVVRQFILLNQHTLPVITAGLHQRLRIKFKNFDNLNEIFEFFRDKVATDVLPAENPALLCKICMKKRIDSVNIPCGHSIACHACSQGMITCRICYEFIKNFQTLRFS